MKRFTLTVVALILSLVVAAVANAATPSRMATDVPVSNVTTSTGAPLPSDFLMYVVSATAQVASVIQETFTQISESIGSGAPLSQAFALPQETITAVNESLASSGLTLDSLVLSEFVPLQVGELSVDEFGDVSAEFEFLTPFIEGEALVVLVGIPDANGVVQWLPCPAEATADGRVRITFSAEVLEQMAGRQVMLAVLSEAQPEA